MAERNRPKQVSSEEIRRAEEYMEELSKSNGHAELRLHFDRKGRVMIEKEKPDGEIVRMPVRGDNNQQG